MTNRLVADVRALAREPRHRDLSDTLPRARAYCATELTAAGWKCAEQPFTVPGRLRMSDQGKPGSALAMRPMRAIQGVNLIATRAGTPREGHTVVVAHLDTVRCSPGADDNASGVAVLLQLARLLGHAKRHSVTLAIVDLEELGQLGARYLAKHLPRPARVICLESVGFFNDTPRSQALPSGFGMLFPHLARAIRQRERRGDFLLAVHRQDTSEFIQRWRRHAQGEGLGALTLPDRRWHGRGQAITRWVNPLLLDLDRSDHAPFWRRRVPAVMITGTAPLRNPRYHRREDTPDTLDYRRMDALSRSLARVLEEKGGSR